MNCQTQRLMSGSLGDAPLPLPHPSPKHQPMGSPRHQAPASQQPAQQKGISQQGPRGMQPQQQKAQTGPGTGVFGPTAAKPPEEAKTLGQPTTQPSLPPAPEDKKPAKDPEETNTPKQDTEWEIQKIPATEPKSSQKKGEQIIKDIKKSRHYDVSYSFTSLAHIHSNILV